MTLRPEHWPRIEDKLRLFVQHVDSGREPPAWLMEFMAEGAREFMRGGKPWQRSSGRKAARRGWQEASAYVLHHDGGLSVEEVVQALGMGDADGADRTRTMRRRIERGAPVAADARRIIIGEMIAGEFADLPTNRRDECLARLRDLLERLDADEAEPGHD